MKSIYNAPQVEVSSISPCTMLCGSVPGPGPSSAPSLGFGGDGSDYELAD